MKRVQVQLSDEQVAELRKHTESTGEAMAATVRGAIDDWIAKRDRDAKWERALSAGGKFHSDIHDVAENHDYYLGEGDW